MNTRQLHIFVVSLLALFALSATPATAQLRGFGAGILIGEPTGLTAKVWLTRATAIDGGIAWSFTREGSFHLHADYLWHSYEAVKSEHTIPLYAGIGGRIKAGRGDRGAIGVRFVGGIAFHLDEAPFEFFLEFAPIMNLIPATTLSINGGLGARYYFQ